MNLKVNYMTKAFNPFVLKTSHVANIRIPVVFKYNILLIAQKERLQLLILRPVCRHLHSIGFPKTELLPESERRIMTKFI